MSLPCLAHRMADACGAAPMQADLTELAAGAIACVRPLAPQVSFELHPLPQCHVVPAQVLEVFVALLQHALLTTRDVPLPRIVIGVQRERGEPEIVVQDNGIGFDTGSAIRLTGGDGDEPALAGSLGRARQLVQDHGGRLRLHPAAWAGTTVSFTLPAAAAAPVANALPARPGGRQSGGRPACGTRWASCP